MSVLHYRYIDYKYRKLDKVRRFGRKVSRFGGQIEHFGGPESVKFELKSEVSGGPKRADLGSDFLALCTKGDLDFYVGLELAIYP